MAISVGPAAQLEATAPQAPEYTLLDTVPVLDGGRALLGGEFFAYPTGLARLYPGCATGTFADKDLENPIENASFLPFGSYLPLQCSAIDLSRGELESRARAAFRAVESEAVERELVTGETNPAMPHLDDGNLTSLGSLSPLEALALLEQAISAISRKGVIIADAATASLWSQSVTTNGVMTTALGTPIAVSSFLSIDSDTSTGIAYATGPIVIYASDTLVLFGFDQTINDQVVIVERSYLINWDTQLQVSATVDYDTVP